MFEGSSNKERRVTIRISEPNLVTYEDGEQAWECYLVLDGLIEIDQPVRETTSFRALVTALMDARILIKEESKRSRLFMVDSLNNNELYPDDGATLKEIFETLD